MAKISSKKNSKAEEKLKQLKKSKGIIEVGVFKGSRYPDGIPTPAVAQYLEYGTNKMPARPFMRQTSAKNNKKWSALYRKLWQTESDPKKILGKIAVRVQSDIRMTIRDGEFAPLKPNTVKAKGFDKTLIDTGHLLRSIDWRIKK